MTAAGYRLIRRMILFFAVAAISSAIALAAAFADHPSSTCRVRIDGKRFGILPIAVDDAEYIRREADRLGKSPSPEIPGPAEGGGRRDFAVDELPPIPPDVACPEGFAAEHSMKLERGDGATGLAFGRLDREGRRAGRPLAAQGWERLGKTAGPMGPRVYVKRRDKENAIVFIDESTGDFLLLRQDGK